MQVRLSAPSKTFLVGEYGVLDGGPALLVATEPRFEVTIETGGEGVCGNIHPNSPAGQWARRERDIFANVNLNFFDPHSGRGGFGASSAQFLLLWAWSQMEHKPFSQLGEGVDVAEILNDYWAQVPESQSRPSGADVVAQAVGGLTLVTTTPLSVQQKQWPFTELDFLIVPTGHKIQTHEHLNTTGKVGFDELKDSAKEVCAALSNSHALGFLEGIRQFSSLLRGQNRLASHTEQLLERWLEAPGVRAGKGCGALGADSFVLFVDKEKSLEIRRAFEISGLPVLASALSLSSGLGIQMEMQSENRPLFVKAPMTSSSTK
jgi:mevalonate kinase